MLKDYEHDKKIFENYNAHFIEYESYVVVNIVKFSK